MGMGTSSAIVGAYVLAGEIGNHCGRAGERGEDIKDGITTALKAYEDKFRPFMDRVQKGVGDPSIFDKIPWTPFTIATLYWLFWLAFVLRLDRIAWWAMKEKLKGWDLPEYEEMLRD